MPDDQSAYANPVPDAIRRQIAAAEEMARQAGVRNVPEAAEEGAGRAPPPPPPPETTENTVELTPNFAEIPAGAGGDRQPQADGQSAPAAPQNDQDNNWEQRYRSLQGRFDAEVGRSRQMRGELDGLREMVNSMQRPPQTQPPAYIQPPSQQIPQADIDAYGPELVEAAQRWAEARVAERMQAYERRLLSLEGGQQQIQAMSAQQRCDMELDRAMMDWREINASPAFFSWLEQPDLFSGQQRLALLREAYGAGDSGRTLAFFRAFQREHTAVQPPLGISQPASSASQPGMGSGAGQVPLTQLAAPGRGSGPIREPGASPAARIWREGDVARLSRDYQRGLWAGREDEYTRRWEDAIAAGREGRYRTQ